MTGDLPRTLIDIAPAGMAADYPRASERLGPIMPGRVPLDHVHVWTCGPKPGNELFCRDCGQWENTKS